MTGTDKNADHISLHTIVDWNVLSICAVKNGSELLTVYFIWMSKESLCKNSVSFGIIYTIITDRL